MAPGIDTSTALDWPRYALLRLMARALDRPRLGRSADRVLLEDGILAHYAASKRPLAVLAVGTRWYTRHHEALFDGHRFASLDIDPAAARHGSRLRHVTACASRADEHFDAGSLDLIVFNGVFGWGLDRRDEVEQAVAGFHRLLRPHGTLVVGWNDRPAHRPFDWRTVQTRELFEPQPAASIGLDSLEVPGWRRHRFELLRKPF